MKLFYIETPIWWTDLDANRHLGNSSYMRYTVQARVGFLENAGLGMEDLASNDIGPAVLREEFSFFKEGHGGEEVIITAELIGLSESGDMFEFEHNFYKKIDGTHMAYSKVTGVWFSMSKRKIVPLPEAILNKLKAVSIPDRTRIMSLTDLKNLPAKPKNINIDDLIS